MNAAYLAVKWIEGVDSDGIFYDLDLNSCTYQLAFDVKRDTHTHPDGNLELYIYATNGLMPNSSFDGIPPEVPTNSSLIAHITEPNLPLDWETKQITFDLNDTYTQLWFFPVYTPPANEDFSSTSIQFDNIELFQDLDTSPDFTLTSDCNKGTWNASFQGLETSGVTHRWELYEAEEQGDTSNGVFVTAIDNVAEGTWSNLSQSKRYYMKHKISSDCFESIVEKSLPIVPFFVEPADFVLEDESGHEKDTFCVGEDIFANGTGTEGEDRYNIHAWRLVDGEKQWFGGLGNIYGDMGTVNITESFANKEFPQQFSPGDYILTIAYSNIPECKVWTPVEMKFSVECCEGFLKPDFLIDDIGGDGFRTLRAHSYERYNSDVTHQWIVLSSENLNSGPYSTVVNVSGPDFEYTDSETGLFYHVIHKVSSQCETKCYGQGPFYRPKSKLEFKHTECKFCGPIDCSLIDEICKTQAPTNLRNNGIRLEWDPVPGALRYIINSPRQNEPQIACDHCKFPPASISAQTEESFYDLPLFLHNACFVWRVIAVCADGSLSPVSNQKCYGLDDIYDGPGPKEKTLDFTVWPNPSRGEINLEIEAEANKQVTIIIHDVMGIEVTRFNQRSNESGTLQFSWNGSSKLKSGAYYVTVTFGETTLSKMLLVE